MRDAKIVPYSLSINTRRREGELLVWYAPEEHREWVRKDKNMHAVLEGVVSAESLHAEALL